MFSRQLPIVQLAWIQNKIHYYYILIPLDDMIFYIENHNYTDRKLLQGNNRRKKDIVSVIKKYHTVDQHHAPLSVPVKVRLL